MFNSTNRETPVSSDEALLTGAASAFIDVHAFVLQSGRSLTADATRDRSKVDLHPSVQVSVATVTPN